VLEYHRKGEASEVDHASWERIGDELLLKENPGAFSDSIRGNGKEKAREGGWGGTQDEEDSDKGSSHPDREERSKEEPGERASRDQRVRTDKGCTPRGIKPESRKNV